MNEPLPRGSETCLVLTHHMQPADANFMGNIHGGIVMKLIDEAPIGFFAELGRHDTVDQESLPVARPNGSTWPEGPPEEKGKAGTGCSCRSRPSEGGTAEEYRQGAAQALALWLRRAFSSRVPAGEKLPPGVRQPSGKLVAR